MLTIAWDVDDVLNNLTAEWYRQAHAGACGAPRYEDLLENPPHLVLGIRLEEYLAALDDFRRTRYATLTPVRPVLDWFLAHGAAYRHLALSSVPPAFSGVTASWVFRHFGRWINTFAFVQSPGPRADASSMAGSKRDYLRWLRRADVLVEDRAETLEAAEELGLRGVLIPQPWNARRGNPVSGALEELSLVLESRPPGWEREPSW
jgi:hypothetical protein